MSEAMDPKSGHHPSAGRNTPDTVSQTLLPPPGATGNRRWVLWVVLVVLALTYAGTTWGLGRIWARVPFVARHRWAL